MPLAPSPCLPLPGNYFYLPKHAVTVQLAALPQGQWRYNPAIYTERLVGGGCARSQPKQ